MQYLADLDNNKITVRVAEPILDMNPQQKDTLQNISSFG